MGNVVTSNEEWKPKIVYCEFNQHDYYALIAVKKDKPYTSTYQKAYRLYIEIVAGESVNEIKQEGQFDELTRDQALLKFLVAADNLDITVKALIHQFDLIEDAVVLIDSSLI